MNRTALIPIEDMPTMYAGLGWRVIVTGLSWSILGFRIIPDSNFFNAITLFALPLAVEYLRFSPRDIGRLFLKRIGQTMSGLCILIGVFGIIGILDITSTTDTFHLIISREFIIFGGASLNISFLWYFLGICVFITIVDWVVYAGAGLVTVPRTGKSI